MFDIGWSEMAVIALVALLVLGPKELPNAMRSFAAFSKKMRRYAQEFRSGVDNIIREAELEDAKKALDTVRRANPAKTVEKWVDPTGEMTQEIKSVEAAAREGDGKSKAAPAVERKALPASGGAATDLPASTAEVAAGSETSPAPVSKIVKEPFKMAPPHSIRPPGTSPAATPAPAGATPEAAKPGTGMPETGKAGDGDAA